MMPAGEFYERYQSQFAHAFGTQSGSESIPPESFVRLEPIAAKIESLELEVIEKFGLFITKSLDCHVPISEARGAIKVLFESLCDAGWTISPPASPSRTRPSYVFWLGEEGDPQAEPRTFLNEFRYIRYGIDGFGHD